MSPGTSWIHNTCNQVHILELVILMSEALETLTRPWSPQPQCPNFKRRSLWLWRSLSCFLWNNKWRWINRAEWKKFKIIDCNFRKKSTYHVTVLISEQVLESRLDHFPLAKLTKCEVQTNKSFNIHNQIWNPVTPINNFCFMHFVVKSFLFCGTWSNRSNT